MDAYDGIFEESGTAPTVDPPPISTVHLRPIAPRTLREAERWLLRLGSAASQRRGGPGECAWLAESARRLAWWMRQALHRERAELREMAIEPRLLRARDEVLWASRALDRVLEPLAAVDGRSLMGPGASVWFRRAVRAAAGCSASFRRRTIALWMDRSWDDLGEVD